MFMWSWVGNEILVACRESHGIWVGNGFVSLLKGLWVTLV